MKYEGYRKISTWIDAVEAEADRPSNMITIVSLLGGMLKLENATENAKSPWFEALVIDQVDIKCPKNQKIATFLANEARRDAGESVSDDTSSELSDNSKDSDTEGSARSGDRDEATCHDVDELREVCGTADSFTCDEEEEPEEEQHPLIEAINDQTVAMQKARKNRLANGFNKDLVIAYDDASENVGSEKMRLKRETVEGHSGEHGFGGLVPAGQIKLVPPEQVVCGGKQWEV